MAGQSADIYIMAALHLGPLHRPLASTRAPRRRPPRPPLQPTALASDPEVSDSEVGWAQVEFSARMCGSAQPAAQPATQPNSKHLLPIQIETDRDRSSQIETDRVR